MKQKTKTTIWELAKQALKASQGNEVNSWTARLEDDYLFKVHLWVNKNALGMITVFGLAIYCAKPDIDIDKKVIYPYQFDNEEEFVAMIGHKCLATRQQFKKQHKINVQLARQLTLFPRKVSNATAITAN